MFGDDSQQGQATTPSNGGFSPSNFTPPASLTGAPVTDNTQSPQADSGFGAPTAPAMPANPLDTPELPAAGTPDPTPAPASAPLDAAPAGGDDLLNLKQQALQQLSPLVGQLEQTPEEKFRTTMMMIQASDDQSLLKAAYEAAQAITDEKERAQALLDVINEINYFTQHGQPQ